MGGCDTSVPLFENSDDHPLYYSLYGQISYPEGGVIRVEPLRDSILAGTTVEAPETVTLTRLATDAVDTLERASREVDEISVHNYRTPADLAAGAQYRVRVEGPQGHSSSAQFSLPEWAPDVEVSVDSIRYAPTDGSRCPPVDLSYDFRRAEPFHIRVDSVRRLGRVAVQYNTTEFGESSPFRWTNNAQHIEATSYRVPVATDEDLVTVATRNGRMGRPPSECRFLLPPPALATEATVTVVAAGDAWPGPDFNTATLRETAAPRSYSNVEQGVGLVVGTRSTTITVPVVVPDFCDIVDCSLLP
jgi:hypothetical protein